MPVLDFWFDFASTYSYPAAMRIAPLAATAGVTIRFRPFLLGPIFKAQGWDTSPFNVYLAKGEDYAAMNEVFRGRFGEEPPVRTTIAAAWVPGNSLVEIDVIAYI